MSWKGCARSEPCRRTGSTPRSGASTSSPTQVAGCSGEPGWLHQPPRIPAPVTGPVGSRCRVTRELCGVHGAGGAPRPDHGAGPARWRPPHPRVHDGQEEDLRHLCLLRVHALQGAGSCSSRSQDGVVTSAGASCEYRRQAPGTPSCVMTLQLIFTHPKVAEPSSSSPRSTPRLVTSTTTGWRRTPASSTPS